MEYRLTASVVTYNNDIAVLKKLFNSIFKYPAHVKLYLVDNSPTDQLRSVSDHPGITYIHNPSNPGFGAAHNLAINEALQMGLKYHLIINPDIYFDQDVITPMMAYMDTNPDIGMLMPQILYPNGDVQYLPKLLPSFLWLVKRKLRFLPYAFDKFINMYELRSVHPNTIYNSPIISGCFSLISTEAFKSVGGYDDGYFMYFEDFDLSRRMHKKYKTIYYPKVSVYHEYESGANKSFELFIIFLKSAARYYNKWGWVFDNEREKINKNTLAQFK